MTIEGMNHFTVLSSNLEKTKAFYINILGLTEGYRPPMESSGAWLYAKDPDHSVLHIMAERPMPENAPGVIDHMAFTATNLQSVIDTLKQQSITHTKVSGPTHTKVSGPTFKHNPDYSQLSISNFQTALLVIT